MHPQRCAIYRIISNNLNNDKIPNEYSDICKLSVLFFILLVNRLICNKKTPYSQK